MSEKPELPPDPTPFFERLETFAYDKIGASDGGTFHLTEIANYVGIPLKDVELLCAEYEETATHRFRFRHEPSSSTGVKRFERNVSITRIKRRSTIWFHVSSSVEWNARKSIETELTQKIMGCGGFNSSKNEFIVLTPIGTSDDVRLWEDLRRIAGEFSVILIWYYEHGGVQAHPRDVNGEVQDFLRPLPCPNPEERIRQWLENAR